MVEVIKYGFYTVNSDYLEYLNKVDSEVYYNPSYRNSIKPFVGIIVGIDNYNFFIPISSAKEKHKKWKNVSDEHFLIYEVIDNSITIDGDIYKYYSDFCLKVKTKVLIKVEKIYQKQKKTGIIRRANCNFSKLEKAMLDWKQ